MVDTSNLIRQIAHLAARQWGHVTRRQLLGLGMAPSTIHVWVAAGRLIPVHAGVYAVGYRRVEPIALACAAVLAGGDGAVLSHDSALALWELRRWPRVPEILTPGHVRRPGIVAHRSATLRRHEVTTQLGIRVTRPARAIADIRSRLTSRQLIRITNNARLAHILTVDEAERLLGHRRNPTRSGFEDDFQAWLERHDLPQPLTDVWVAGDLVDAFYPEQRLVIELDHYGTHGDPESFVDDRERDARKLQIGLRTLRLTPERLTAAEAERLRRTLAVVVVP
jgi:hypothetical protein